MSRRPPSPFLTARLAEREWLTPRLARVTLQGDDLKQLRVTQPASSVRVLLPDPDRPDPAGRLELPGWDGNRFVRADGRRPLLRTLTPRHHDPGTGRLVLDVVVHGEGAASTWASTAPIGGPAAVSGPARGYEIDPAARALVLGGDETALAAIGQIVEALPGEVEVTVMVETGAGGGLPPLPAHPRLRSECLQPTGREPGRALADRLGDVDLPEGSHLWAAGEAGAMQRARRRLFLERGLPRQQATIRGYWKHGRTSEDDAGG